MTSKVEIILLQETVKQSVISDAVTFVMVTSLCLIGWWLDSTTLKIVGGLMVMVFLLARAAGKKRMTIAEARARLDEIEQGKGR